MEEHEAAEDDRARQRWQGSQRGQCEMAEAEEESQQTGRLLATDERRETVEGDGSDENCDGEQRGEWDHSWSPEHCPACQQTLFECGCLDVRFASKERRDKESVEALGTDGRGVVFGRRRTRIGRTGRLESWGTRLVPGSVVGTQRSMEDESRGKWERWRGTRQDARADKSDTGEQWK